MSSQVVYTSLRCSQDNVCGIRLPWGLESARLLASERVIHIIGWDMAQSRLYIQLLWSALCISVVVVVAIVERESERERAGGGGLKAMHFVNKGRGSGALLPQATPLPLQSGLYRSGRGRTVAKRGSHSTPAYGRCWRRPRKAIANIKASKPQVSMKKACHTAALGTEIHINKSLI